MKSIVQKSKYGASQRRIRNIEAWASVGPVMVYMFIFSFLPVMFVIYLSFTEWNGIIGLPQWVGLKNFVNFFSSSQYLNILWQTVYIGGIGLILGMTLPFLLALLLNLKIRGQSAYRTVWYIPVVTSFAVMSQIVIVFLNPMDGSLNNFLLSIGLQRVDWQLSTFWMVFWITIFIQWKGIGGGALLFLAGLQSVDPSVYEAAKIDGAGRWRRMVSITVPLMKPMWAFVFVMGINGMFQVFEPIYFITQGGPKGTTTVIVYQLWKDAFVNFQMGMASVGSVVILLIVMACTMVSLKLSKSIY
ncbi:carbohydrate ABC transporter permease [Paenibacillus sp. GCM10027626]|uniref:carbohydrate ABC transporter permease n=1 Tax=Paenibacillus sp. GCM10027626 TaxID=3273411 RepID=UPI00363E6C65